MTEKYIKIDKYDNHFFYKDREMKILHRDDGPAVVRANGSKHWYVNGKLHREDGPAIEWSDGSKHWYVDGKRHREDGPAIEWSDGSKHWFQNGKCHREGGPAVVWANGSKHWYVDGKRHREDGPAIEWSDGSKYWYFNDSLHREDGPAIEGVDGSKFWYIHGKELTQECYKITTRLERRNLLFTIEEIAQYINGWVTGPFDTVHEIGKGTLLNVLSQLECEQDGIVAFFNRRKGTTL